MDTQEIVTAIKEDYAPDWSREKILGYLDRCQNKLFSIDCPLTTFFVESDPTFPLPILNTTAGALKYDVTGSNLLDSAGGAVTLAKNGYAVTARKVRYVFIQASNRSYGKFWTGPQFDWAGLNAAWRKRLGSIQFAVEPSITIPRTENEPCKIVFPEDPGTHDNKYYVEFYYNPVPLVSESIPLSLDGNMWDEALIDGVVGLLEKSQYGKSDKWEAFLGYHMKKFRSYGMGELSNRSPLQMQARECG